MKLAFAVFLAILAVIAGRFFPLHILPSASSATSAAARDLAQIMNIEFGALKQWQKEHGFQSDLGPGASGTDVSLLQQALATDPSLYPQGAITGFFGAQTAEAVRRFQASQNIPVTGTVGPLTRQKLNGAYLSELCPTGGPKAPDLSLIRLDKDHGIPLDYVPPDLVDISRAVPTQNVACLRKPAFEALQKMFLAAAQDGIRLRVTSGYRSADTQRLLYAYWLGTEGDSQINAIALPGHSEHQLGTAVDLAAASENFAGVDPAFGDSPEGRWLIAHAPSYGFIQSYPQGGQLATGYDYEPWHFRFWPDVAGASSTVAAQ